MRTRYWNLIVACAVSMAIAACGDAAAPKSDAPPAKAPASETKTPLVPVKKAADWCKEHGVPESACTKCNTDLIASFKAKGDWCDQHGVPKSQCIACDPSIAAKLVAMAPK